MQLSNVPAKLVLPFANAGAKNAIPVASQIGITPGAASLTDGFPPLTRTPLSAGGVPPSGQDMNGVLYELSAILRWANAGGGYAYDATFATSVNVNGYPKGARIMRSDGEGYWLNTAENNTTDPEDAGTAVGWVPDFTGGTVTVAMASANVTLTPLEYGKRIIIITGTLTANLNLVFPDDIPGEWVVMNNTTGAYSITCKTVTGTGVTVDDVQMVAGDGVNIYALSVGAAYAKLAAAQSFTAGQRGAIVALTDGATITPDFAAGNNFSVTLGGNRTLANPSNLVAGQSGVIAITQDGTGGRTLAFGAYWKFTGGGVPTLTATAAAVDLIAYHVESATRISAVFHGDMK